MFYEIQTNAQNVNTYFEINRNTGDITVRIPLYNDPTDTARYTFIVVARDGGNPQQVSTQNAQVTINVIRNLNAPVFQNQPYETTVPFFVNNGVQVYDVLATDIDTVVSRRNYSKTCVKQPLSKRLNIVFQDQFSPNAGQKYYRMLQGEHSAIFLTFIV